MILLKLRLGDLISLISDINDNIHYYIKQFIGAPQTIVGVVAQASNSAQFNPHLWHGQDNNKFGNKCNNNNY